MRINSLLRKSKFLFLILLSFGLNFSYVNASNDQKSNLNNLENRINIKFNKYILGPGDEIFINMIDIFELSGVHRIDEKGFIYVPRLKYVNVSGLNVGELENLLIDSYKKYVNYPEIEIRVLKKRPVTVMVRGEVIRPGLYTLIHRDTSFSTFNEESSDNNITKSSDNNITNNSNNNFLNTNSRNNNILNNNNNISSPYLFPTLFEAIQKAQGITSKADLSAIKIIRLTPDSEGSDRLTTEVNFLNLLNSGDQTQNIPLADGDLIVVKESEINALDQFRLAGSSNLNPEFIRVYLAGTFREPKGAIELPQGITLAQGIAVAGGLEIFSSSKIEFIRFENDGNIDRRFINLNNIKRETFISKNNPILRTGDIIRARSSSLGYATEAIDKVGRPILSIFTILNLFDD